MGDAVAVSEVKMYEDGGMRIAEREKEREERGRKGREEEYGWAGRTGPANV